MQKSTKPSKRNAIKRSNIFQDDDDDREVKKPVMRDPSTPTQTVESNTLRIENITLNFTDLCHVFCVFGSIYSCRLTDQNVAYVAFTNTESAQYAIENLNGKIFDGNAIRISYAPKILCNGQVLLDAHQVDQITGLPFNAQYEKESIKVKGSFGQKTRVVVQIPTADLCDIIHQTIHDVLKNGTDFERKLVKREQGNPKYDFLTNLYSAEHAYYCWKTFSLKNGDLPNWWKCQPFVMVGGGPTWFPPKIPFEEKKPSYPESFEYDSAASESSDSGSDFEDQKKKKYSSKLTQMSLYHRVCFEDKLRNLTTYRGDIAEAMIFCMRHSYAAEELANIISDSLRIHETVVYPTKVARLYLLSDILFNASSIPSAWKFRAAFEPHLPGIFAGFGKIAKSIPGLIRQDKFRAMVTSPIAAWERWVIFPSDYTDHLFLTYKNGSVDVSSLESRLKLQQENKIGLYSHDYESKEKMICMDTKQSETEQMPDVLPAGFKKIDSWISVDHDAEQDPPVFVQVSEPLKERDISSTELEESNRLVDLKLIKTAASCTPQDLDGESLKVASNTIENVEEDVDGIPLNLTAEDDESEDLDGEPLFRFS